MKKDKDFSLTNKRPLTKSLANKDMLYGRFIKVCMDNLNVDCNKAGTMFNIATGLCWSYKNIHTFVRLLRLKFKLIL